MSSLPSIYRRNSPYIAAPCWETTVFVGIDGKLTTISFEYSDTASKLVIRRFVDSHILAAYDWGLPRVAGGTVMVADGLVHVFAASPFIGTANKILHITFDDSWAPSPVQTVYTAAAPDNICNLGICSTPLGYIMCVETQQLPRQIFFLRSTDLTAWSEIGNPVATGEYLGSPKIYWSQRRGQFFVTYLRKPGNEFFTAVASLPKDLSTFTIAPKILMFPDGVGEAVNASDLTMAEQGGVTHILYFDGNQLVPASSRAAAYFGTMEDLWEEFFPFSISQAPPPVQSVNLIPQMTGANTSGATISASSQFYNGAFLPWHAADRNPASFWHCNNQLAYPHSWQASFAAAKTVKSYSITCRDPLPGQAPKNFSLIALINGSWQTIDTQQNVSGYVVGTPKTFTLPTAITSTAFMLVVGANVEGSANLSFSEIALCS